MKRILFGVFRRVAGKFFLGEFFLMLELKKFVVKIGAQWKLTKKAEPK